MDTIPISQDRELLIRIDERMEALQTQVKQISDDIAIFKMTVVTKDYLEQELDKRLEMNEAITYGFAAIILVAVATAVVYKVVRKK